MTLGGFVDACTYNEATTHSSGAQNVFLDVNPALKMLEVCYLKRLQWHAPETFSLYSKENDSPKSKNVGLFGEGELVLFCVRGELLDELGGQVTQPAVGDPQFVFSPAERTTTPCCLILQSHCGSSRRVTTPRWLCIMTQQSLEFWGDDVFMPPIIMYL